MAITAEQRTYARLAGILFLAHVVLEGVGDSVTIIVRGGESLASDLSSRLCGADHAIHRSHP